MLSGSLTHASRMDKVYSWCTGEEIKNIPFVSQEKRIIKENTFRQGIDFNFYQEFLF